MPSLSIRLRIQLSCENTCYIYDYGNMCQYSDEEASERTTVILLLWYSVVLKKKKFTHTTTVRLCLCCINRSQNRDREVCWVRNTNAIACHQILFSLSFFLLLCLSIMDHSFQTTGLYLLEYTSNYPSVTMVFWSIFSLLLLLWLKYTFKENQTNNNNHNV